MSKKEKQTHINPINLPRRLREGVLEADELLADHKPQQAVGLLRELDKKFPHQPDILSLMANACLDTGDQNGYLHAIHQVHELTPNKAEVKLGLAGAYAANGFMALALLTFRQFLKRWPEAERAREAQKTILKLESGLTGFLSEIDFSLETGLDFACKYEEMRLNMEQGNYNRCRQHAKTLLQQRPNFAPILNNLSLVEWLEGNLPGAIELGQKVLGTEPDNIHALSNLTRFHFMQGRKEEANLFAGRLKDSTADASERWVKKTEALSFIGDDDGVLSIIEQARRAKELDTLNGMVWHWCAVAEYRSGNTSKARKYWQKSAQEPSSSALAQANLEELKKPLHESSCPQAFSLNLWISQKTIRDLAVVVERASRRESDHSFREKVNVFFDVHPELIHFVPQALSAGDSDSRKFALQMAEMAAHPNILSSLKEFVLGQDGPDALRLEASQILSRYGVFQSGATIDLWLKGEWTPIMLLGFQISKDAARSDLKPAALRLMEEAIYALRASEFTQAESHLRKALKIQGNEPGLLNNLAMALSLQGKHEESDLIADEIPVRFPDYFFGQVISVRKAVMAKQFEKAKILLDKMMQKTELHVTEFSALCACQIDFFLASEKAEGAISWFEMWEKGYPEDPEREKYQEPITLLSGLSRLKNGFSKRGRKIKGVLFDHE